MFLRNFVINHFLHLLFRSYRKGQFYKSLIKSKLEDLFLSSNLVVILLMTVLNSSCLVFLCKRAVEYLLGRLNIIFKFLFCIICSFLRYVLAHLFDHTWQPYVIIGRIHILYNSSLFFPFNLDFRLSRGKSALPHFNALSPACRTCFLKVSFLSKTTPRYLTESSIGISVPCIHSVICGILFGVLLKGKIVACVFPWFIFIFAFVEVFFGMD